LTRNFLYSLIFVLAAHAALGVSFAVTINTNIPGVTDKTDPCGAVFGFYTFALMIGGVLAFAAITYGGVKYVLAAGNPSGQSEGKEWVKGALYGLLLLVGAYLVLKLINPDITKCGLKPLPKLAQVTITALPPAGSMACQGGTCVPLTSAGLACKDPNSCSAAGAEVAVLVCVQQKSGQSLRITEAYPPTTAHQSQCHTNGCCVDLTPSSGQSATCAQVQAIIQAAQQCGAVAVANEWSPQCGGTAFGTTTGYNIHIQGC